MDDKKSPKLWLTALKLAVGALVIIVLVGLGLYYSAKYSTYDPKVEDSGPQWGISKDSPIRSNR
jgi:hypothetical protein